MGLPAERIIQLIVLPWYGFRGETPSCFSGCLFRIGARLDTRDARRYVSTMQCFADVRLLEAVSWFREARSAREPASLSIEADSIFC